MKKLVTLLIFMAVLLIPKSAKAIDDDKLFHFAVGFLATGAVYGIFSEQHCTYDFQGNEKCEYVVPLEQRILYSLIFSLTLGVMKELADSHPGGTGFDWVDLGYGALGSGAAILMFQIPF